MKSLLYLRRKNSGSTALIVIIDSVTIQLLCLLVPNAEVVNGGTDSAILSLLPAYFQGTADAAIGAADAAVGTPDATFGAAAPADALYRSLLVGFSQLRCHMYGITLDDEEEEILRIAADRQSCLSRVCDQVAGLALAELRQLLIRRIADLLVVNWSVSTDGCFRKIAFGWLASLRLLSWLQHQNAS